MYEEELQWALYSYKYIVALMECKLCACCSAGLTDVRRRGFQINLERDVVAWYRRVRQEVSQSCGYLSLRAMAMYVLPTVLRVDKKSSVLAGNNLK